MTKLRAKPTRPSRIRVVVAEEYALVAEAIANLLRDSSTSVLIASSGEELAEAIRSMQPDLVLSDVSLASVDCVEAMRDLAELGYKPPFLFFPSNADAATVTRAMRYGAKGFIHRRCSGAELRRAISCILDGNTYIAASLLAAQLESLVKPLIALSARHAQILKLVATGMRAQEIANALQLSPRTIESHKRLMMRKFGVRSSLEMVRVARSEGLID